MLKTWQHLHSKPEMTIFAKENNEPLIIALGEEPHQNNALVGIIF